MDWGLGRYQRIAADLLPAAAAVIEATELQPGDRVLDIGCGTGNAALLAAERGAVVIGVDPAAALLEVAIVAAECRGLTVTFQTGEAAALPVAEAAFDAVVSVFGVIFAPDAKAAAAELARVTAPGGRIVLAAWLPGGVLAEAMRLRREAIAAVASTVGPRGPEGPAGGGGQGSPAGPPPTAWHDRKAVAGLLGRYGFTVAVDEREISFVAASAGAFAEVEFANHPMWVGARNLLEPVGAWPALRDRTAELFAAANEEQDGFGVTSRYAIVTARHA